MVPRNWHPGFVLLLAAALSGDATPSPTPGLAAYMGRNLGLLSTQQRSRLLAQVARLTGDPRVQGLGQDVFAYWVTPFHGGNADRMLLLASPNWDIPGHPEAWIYVFTREWKPVASSTFPLGEREFLIDARVSRDNPLHRDLLMVRVSSAAPLHASHPGDERLRVQYYAYLHNRMALVREENIRGEPTREIYDASGPNAGPTPPAFGLDNLLTQLASGDPAEQAEILVWLTGWHSGGVDNLKKWRSNPDVQSTLASLRQSSNPWISQYAALGFTAPLNN